MLNTQTHPPRQVLLRLPEDLAAKLARAVPPRKRNRYIVDLLRQDLRAKQDLQSLLLTEAADRMNELEAQYPELVREAKEWTNAELTDSVEVSDPDFDRETFERELAQAQAARRPSKAVK